MKFSKTWLQQYIKETLPEDGVIVETLSKKAFEVEEVISISDDTVFEIKVLPNRAHDALGHRGMAKEICACLGYVFKDETMADKENMQSDASVALSEVVIMDERACTRFMSIRIDGVKVEESPVWLKKRLEAIGQRSINNIVDITNYVQFSINKPMHAYDTRSIEGNLSVRFAKGSEVLTTLDEKELKLDAETLVIADDKKVLGLAGIKGGKYSGIKGDTTSIILESANFNPALIRKTSQKYDIRTDASKRFENGIANSLVAEGVYTTANLIKEICPNSKVSKETDVYPNKDEDFRLSVSLSQINEILGSDYDNSLVKETLSRLLFNFESKKEGEYVIEVPSERLDIRIKEDVAEEVGRIIGYDKLVPTLPNLNRIGLFHKRMFYENKIMEILVSNGFSEVITYTFGSEGKVELVKGLAEDKKMLRATLGNGIRQSLSLNINNAPLLGQKIIRIFEFGNVFTHDGETRHLSLAIDDGAKKSNFKDEMDAVISLIKKNLNIKEFEITIISEKPHIIEVNFDKIIENLPKPQTYEKSTVSNTEMVSYKSISPYPFIARDIAMWVPDMVSWESVRDLCFEVRNPLVIRIDLFDTFTKETDDIKKTSLAFRLVFQSYEKTLTDEEVNVMMKPYYEVLEGKGYEIR